MLDIHRRTGYLFLVIVVAQIILVSAQVQTSTGTKVLQAVTFGIFSQVQLGAAGVFGSVRHVWDGYFNLRYAAVDNERLREQIAGLELRLQQQQAQARRGAQLEQLLALREQTSLTTLAANVIASDASGMFHTVTIDRGSQHGVRQDLAVIAPQGVVGRVVDQPPLAAAKVQLLVDRNAGAGGIIERTNAGGVVVGHDGDPPLRMEYVPNLADVKVGDRVVTSGLDGIYPPGFVIGHVERVQNGNGLYKDIAIRPIVDFSALQTVLVILEPPAASERGAAKAPPAQTRTEPTPTQPPASAPAAAPAPARTPAQAPGQSAGQTPVRPAQPASQTPSQTPTGRPPGGAS